MLNLNKSFTELYPLTRFEAFCCFTLFHFIFLKDARHSHSTDFMTC